MKLYIVTFLVSLSLLSCKDNITVDGDFTYFGGEIINPNNNYITIGSHDTKRDTIYLDSKNRFFHKIDKLQPGLYTFVHGGEYQMMVLEPNDSILIRLNTNDFDESLVYTGKGSKKNNYLIKSYLDDELENKKFVNHHQLEPEEFDQFIDSIRASKLKHLGNFLVKVPSSDLFKKIAEANINYNYFAYREIYPFGYYGNNKLVHFKDLPEGFYDFRGDINYNDNALGELATYNRFLFCHFSNLALKEYYKNVEHHHTFDRMSLNYNLEKLRLIDSTIKNEAIKNYLLKHTTKEFIFYSDNAQATNEILNSYFEKNTDELNKNYIEDLVNSVNRLIPGNILPDIEIVDINNKTLNLSSVITKPTVICFWSSNYKMQYRNSHYMAKKLKSKFPEINFIAVNINNNDLNYWKKTLKKFRYPTQNEYKFKNPDKAVQKLAITYSNKITVVDANARIVNSNANLFSTEFEAELKSLLALK